MLCRYITFNLIDVVGPTQSFSLAAGAENNRMLADFAFFFRARRLRFAAVCPPRSLTYFRSLCVRSSDLAMDLAFSPLRRSHEHSTGHWRVSDV